MKWMQNIQDKAFTSQRSRSLEEKKADYSWKVNVKHTILQSVWRV